MPGDDKGFLGTTKVVETGAEISALVFFLQQFPYCMTNQVNSVSLMLLTLS